MTSYACFRTCPRGVDYLGTVEAESIKEAEATARLMWSIDWGAGEALSIEEDKEQDQ